jgi:hypothetical protein
MIVKESSSAEEHRVWIQVWEDTKLGGSANVAAIELNEENAKKLMGALDAWLADPDRT